MTGADEFRTDSARDLILRAAAHQFAHRPYHQVSLDDILAEAQVTKGAMYFHFRSKHALAVALIDLQVSSSRSAVDEVLANRLSGLETLIDMTYLFAVRDLTDMVARAALYLMEAIGRTDNIQVSRIERWVEGFTLWAQRARDDGDLRAGADPRDVARLFIVVHSGLRQINDLDDSEGYLKSLEAAWLQLLPGVVAPDRIDYFEQFIRRRTVVATRNVGRC